MKFLIHIHISTRFFFLIEPKKKNETQRNPVQYIAGDLWAD